MKTEILLKSCPITPKMMRLAHLYETLSENMLFAMFPKRTFEETFAELRKPPSNKLVYDSVEKYTNVTNHNLRYVDIVDSTDRILITRYGSHAHITMHETDYFYWEDELKKEIRELSQWSKFNPLKYILLSKNRGELENLMRNIKFTRIYNTYTREWWLDIYHD